MSISQTLLEASNLLAWSGLGLIVITFVFFLFNWNGKFRLVGTTIFTLLLSASCLAFTKSYRPPFIVEGAQYAPVVYDNGSDLVVAQAPEGFPNEAIQPTLEQIAGNLNGRAANNSLVHVRIRKLETVREGVSKPVILGEVLRDIIKKETLPSTEPNGISVFQSEENSPVPEKIESTFDLSQSEQNSLVSNKIEETIN